MTGMDFVAVKMLMGDRLKYLSLIAGLAFATLLVTQQASIFNGFAGRTESWIRDCSDHDLWVIDEQVEFSEDNKPMQQTSVERVRGVEGVDWAVPMYKGYLKARLDDGTALVVRVIGLDDATLIGGPLKMVDGELADLRQEGAVLIHVDQAATSMRMKRGHDGEGPRALRLGDRLSINDVDAVVAGTYSATPEFFWDPLVYTTYSRALRMAPPERKLTNFVLVRVKSDEDVATVAARIHATTGYEALDKEQFAARTRQFILEQTGILINFGMTIVLGFVIGVIVAGQTLYNFVLDNLRQFGALKAMGASNGVIVRMVVLQVLLVGSLGFGLGLGVTTLSGRLFANSGLAFEMTWQIQVIGAIAILGCCALAGLISVVRVLRLEPAIVFRS